MADYNNKMVNQQFVVDKAKHEYEQLNRQISQMNISGADVLNPLAYQNAVAARNHYASLLKK